MNSDTQKSKAMLLAHALIFAVREKRKTRNKVTLPQLHKLVLTVEMMALSLPGQGSIIDDEDWHALANHIEWKSVSDEFEIFGDDPIDYEVIDPTAFKELGDLYQKQVGLVAENMLDCMCHSMSYITGKVVESYKKIGNRDDAMKSAVQELSNEMGVAVPESLESAQVWLVKLNAHATQKKPLSDSTDDFILSLYELRKFDSRVAQEMVLPSFNTTTAFHRASLWLSDYVFKDPKPSLESYLNLQVPTSE